MASADLGLAPELSLAQISLLPDSGPQTHEICSGNTAAHAGTGCPPPKASPQMRRLREPRTAAHLMNAHQTESACWGSCQVGGAGCQGVTKWSEVISPGQCRCRIGRVWGGSTQTTRPPPGGRTGGGPNNRTKAADPPALALTLHSSVFSHVSLEPGARNPSQSPGRVSVREGVCACAL